VVGVLLVADLLECLLKVFDMVFKPHIDFCMHLEAEHLLFR